MVLLEPPRCSEQVDVAGVSQGGSPAPDGIVENRADGPDQAVELAPSERSGHACRQDPRSEASLVGVHVADTSEHGLIEEERLQGCPAGRRELGQSGRVDPVHERVGAEPGKGDRYATWVEVGSDEQLAEGSLVDKAELAVVVEGDPGMGMGDEGHLVAGWSHEEQLAAHPEVYDERGSVVEPDEEVLSPPARDRDGSAGQRDDEVRDALTTDRPQAGHDHVVDPLADDEGLEAPPYGLDLRKLWHQSDRSPSALSLASALVGGGRGVA